MKIFKLRKIEKRILEIKKVLADENREKNMAIGIAMPVFEKILAKANRPLVDELDELNTERKFIRDRRTYLVSTSAILISLLIAFFVPRLEQILKQKADIQSLYQTIIANQDIFISDFDEFKNSQNNNQRLPLPELYIDFPITENIHKILQRELGIDQYRFLLYYFNQTKLLNDEINQIRSKIATEGSISTDSSIARRYQSIMSLLEEGNWQNSKFNYIHDTSCLLYMFQRSFSFVDVAEREKTISCSSDSLNRLFYQYGYIKQEIPKWLIPELRSALNQREPGMGDRLIGKD